ncbi:serine hydrolase domain-containing protein [Chitinophaga vietnamensis]|uniref:serine hydrolase domain-containing protein n=1 Tax=Chitinophaga vietnamensis TaxID=2593957 RepID=UPI001178754E|nr:serine hydrolase [Chitinophaga vietnamensis]
MSKHILLILLLCATGYTRAQAPFDTALRNNKGIYSLVISMHDSIVYAKGYNGKDYTELCNNQSLTKSIEAVLIGIAIDRGLIPSTDTKIAAYFPALITDKDKRKTAITIADVMNQASGLWHEDLMRLDRYLRLSDPSDYVLRQPLLADPGSELHYNNAASHLLSVILTKATGQATEDFARQYLFEPLGIHQTEWPRMADGYNDGSGLLSVHMSTAAVNKIGQLLLDEGRYQGRQLVSAKWVQALLSPEKKYPAPWGLVNTDYALCFYHKIYRGEKMIFGMGWGGQYLILLPHLHAVITVNQDVNDRNAIQQSNTFMGQLFPLIFDWLQTLKK